MQRLPTLTNGAALYKMEMCIWIIATNIIIQLKSPNYPPPWEHLMYFLLLTKWRYFNNILKSQKHLNLLNCRKVKKKNIFILSFYTLKCIQCEKANFNGSDSYMYLLSFQFLWIRKRENCFYLLVFKYLLASRIQKCFY